ncbi:MAG: hypothetical protein ABSC73_09110 [Acidimicrobiales bacterium]|jgi:hypothetical protein
MAGEDLLGVSSGHRAVEAMLFLGGCYLAFDAMSTVNSSPWTHETFTSPEKMASGRDYVMQSIGVSLAFGAVSSAIGREPWPLLGVLAGDAYLYWLYRRAFGRAVGDGKPHGLGLIPGILEADVSGGPEASLMFGGL